MDIITWWEIAQVAGAGAAVVLGPLCFVLWRKVESDSSYIRNSDKQNLEVLLKLSNVLDESIKDTSRLNTQILNELKNENQKILDAIKNIK